MDERDFDDFYSASFRRITGQVFAMIGDWDEAQECVQEAFARGWAKRELGRVESPEAWVRTVAYRLAVNRWRRAVRGRKLLVAAATVEMHSTIDGLSDARTELVAALQKLPRAQSQALVLHHIADLPVREVAREVGVPEGTIKARLSRGRAALAQLLAVDAAGVGGRGDMEGAKHA